MKIQRAHILIVSLLLGGILGVLLHGSDQSWIGVANQNLLQPIGQIFLRLIFMIVVPLIFSALVLGVVELAEGRGLGRVAAKTLGWTVVSSAFAVLIGITLVNTLQPGSGLSFDPTVIEAQASSIKKIEANALQSKTLPEIIVNLIPKNPIDSAARALDGEIIALMIFALLFGTGLVLSHHSAKDSVVVKLLKEVMETSMKIVDFAMIISPVAVFCLVFNSGFIYGAEVFKGLLFYVFVVVAGLLIQLFVVYGALLKFGANQNIFSFLSKIEEVILYAFSTASSNATLPKTIAAAENNLKLRPDVSRFVLTVGSSANQNGTALFEGVTVLFLAQVYGIDLPLTAQVTVVIVSIIAGIGTAGIPGGSLPPMMILLQTVGIPAEGIGLILGVDRFLDMARTTINVVGDLVIAALVSGKEGPA